jgi:hypothetical protein
VFVACSSCSCSALFSIRRGFEFSLGKVSDGPHVPGGQSAGAWRTVRVLPADGLLFVVRLWRFCCLFGQSAAQAGRSVARVWTVHDTLPDSPRGLCGQSAPPGRRVRQSLAVLLIGSILSFLLSCFRVCFKESFLRLRLFHNLVVLTVGVIRSIAHV